MNGSAMIIIHCVAFPVPDVNISELNCVIQELYKEYGDEQKRSLFLSRRNSSIVLMITPVKNMGRKML